MPKILEKLTLWMRQSQSFKDCGSCIHTKHPVRVRKVLVAQGDHYHLQEIFDALNKRYFNEQIQAGITWFGSKERKARSHRVLGLYDFDQKIIKIHRLLDTPIFPGYFIEYVVYHEMLHEVFPPLEKGRGKRWIHHGDFKKHERLFVDFSLAKAWEKENTRLFFSGRG